MKSNIIELIDPRFVIGDLVTTIGADQKLSDSDIQKALNRHSQCDWGNLCDQDKMTNDLAFENQGRLMSEYWAKNGTKFWIITEWDRSVTTILLPSEY